MTLEQALQTVEQLQRQISQLQHENAKLQGTVEKLQGRVKQNSTNSSKPPSSDGPAVVRLKKEPTGRKPGGQQGHKGAFRAWLPQRDVTRISRSPLRDSCPHCGGTELTDESWRRVKQVQELPVIKPQVTEHRVQRGRCAACGRNRAASLPVGTPQGCFGPRAQAAIAILSGSCGLSRRNTAFLANKVLGLDMALGTVSNTEKRVSDSLAKPTGQVRAALRKQPFVHVDETGGKRRGLRRYSWGMSTDKLAAYQVNQRRSGKALTRLVGKTFAGTVVCDGFSAYHRIPSECKQRCWAHLHRQVQALVQRDGPGATLSVAVSRDISELFALHRQCLQKPRGAFLFGKASKTVRRRMGHRIVQLRQVDPKAASLTKTFLKRSKEVWAFMRKPQLGLPMTNNQAERDIRPLVMWRKSSQGTRSVRGDRYVERIQSVTQTCRKQKRNPFLFVQQALDACWTGLSPPSLLPALQGTPT